MGDTGEDVFTSFRRMTKKISELISPSTGKGVHCSNKSNKSDLYNLEWTERIPHCPVYHPSEEEFEDPLRYLHKIAPEASNYGICKIVSPLKASISAAEVLGEFKFSTSLQPLRLPKWNRNQGFSYLKGKRNYTYSTFKRRSDEQLLRRFSDCEGLSPENLEKKFWQVMSNGSKGRVDYAVNIDGSAFSSDPDDPLGTSKWNLKTLPKLPDSLLHLIEHEIPGLKSPMLYIGMLYSMFAWHLEDHYLYSINYLHAGAPKTWYGVPSNAVTEFETAVLNDVYRNSIPTGDVHKAFQRLAGKTTMFPPSFLLNRCVPVYKAIQMPGEFVITFPAAYHAGFSHGFTCGEAVNFATDDWFQFGALACKRYAVLHMPAILPHEELLCKRTMHLLKYEEKFSLELSSSYRPVILQFLQFMSIFNGVLVLLCNTLSDSGESEMKIPDPVEHLSKLAWVIPDHVASVVCSRCKHASYLAFLQCHSCFSVICPYHDMKSTNCSCGGKWELYTRREVPELEYMQAMLTGMLSGTISEARSLIASVRRRYEPLVKELDVEKNARMNEAAETATVEEKPQKRKPQGNRLDFMQNATMNDVVETATGEEKQLKRESQRNELDFVMRNAGTNEAAETATVEEKQLMVYMRSKRARNETDT